MFKSIHIKFENCYGIKKLEHTFNFSEGKKPARTAVIYSPNGSMKTSLAKTFLDLQTGKDTTDKIFTGRKSIRKITKNDGREDLEPEEVFVILSMDTSSDTSSTSTLLVNEKLKKQYDELTLDIKTKEKALLSKLGKTAGFKKDLSETFLSDVRRQGEDFPIAARRYRADVESKSISELEGLKYKQLINSNLDDFIADEDNRQAIEDYTTCYNNLVEESVFFKKGVFDQFNASTVADNLEKNGFFNTGHEILLNGDDQPRTVKNKLDLTALIEEEKNRILTDATLKAKFDNLEPKLNKTTALRDFRVLSSRRPGILSLLQSKDDLREKLWIQYFRDNKDDYINYIEAYTTNEPKISGILELAAIEAPQWKAVVNEYNKRFSVPFEVMVSNTKDVVLNEATARLRFKYIDRDTDEEVIVKDDQLESTLSTGERRAFYILNLLFKIRARELKGLQTLYIVDDIADSFDYKNKYAIIQYLKDIQESGNSNQIILTHNFDFYRTVHGRLEIFGPNRYVAIREKGKVILAASYLKGTPFDTWKKQLNDPCAFVASIPFIRNLSEYMDFGEDDEEMAKSADKLTLALHVKPQESIPTVKDILMTFNTVLNIDVSKINFDGEQSIHDFIIKTADESSRVTTVPLPLRDKICLSIAIRVVAERLMQKELTKKDIQIIYGQSQTGILVGQITKVDGMDGDFVELMKEVGLMTPENIHLNSFMFEPLLDLSANHIIDLFKRVLAYDEIDLG